MTKNDWAYLIKLAVKWTAWIGLCIVLFPLSVPRYILALTLAMVYAIFLALTHDDR